MEKENAAVAAPTGCYKCGKPGHWSRDCPSSAPVPSSSGPPSASTDPASAPSSTRPKAAEKPKKPPRSRPKLTPELLLSDDGLGYVLRHFPRAFKYRGRGHEVSDLENFIGLYREWHSHTLPYYSFEHFVHKVEQVAATRRVKMCLGELRERVAKGGDPTKWRESPTINDDDVYDEKEAKDPEKDPESLFDNEEEAPLRNNDADDIEEDMLQEVFEKATEEEPLQNLQSDSHPISETMEGVVNQEPKSSNSSENGLTEEQKARMEANRLKALERAAAAKARSLPSV